MNLKPALGFWNRLSKREKTILLVTGLVIGALVSDQIVIRPVFGTFRSLKQELSDLRANIKKSVRLLSQKESIEKEVKEYTSYRGEAKSPEEEAVALLKFVEDLANTAGVNLLYAKPGGSKTEERVKKYYVNLECEAQMSQLVAFFFQVENSDRLLKIEKFSIQLTTEGSSITKSAVTISRTVVE